MSTIRVPRKRPDAYQHGDLRPALIQAGLKLLTEGGTRSLSLRAAAQLAGVSHAAPYRHFRDKDALVAAIAEEGFRLLTRRPGLQEAGAEAYGVLRGLVAEGIQRGRLRHADPDQMSLAAWSMVHGLSMLLIEGQLDPAQPRGAAARGLTETVVRFLEQGLRA
jgi:AcrR family transcriptional regulator